MKGGEREGLWFRPGKRVGSGGPGPLRMCAQSSQVGLLKHRLTDRAENGGGCVYWGLRGTVCLAPSPAC